MGVKRRTLTYEIFPSEKQTVNFFIRGVSVDFFKEFILGTFREKLREFGFRIEKDLQSKQV